ncbi:MAG: hypothetical protein QM648_07405 [Solirubrobacterales bacterium]
MPSKPLRALAPLLAATIFTVFAASAGAAPANDDFSGATALSGNRGSLSFDLVDATNQAGEPMPGDGGDRTVWFKYTPSADGIASFSTCRDETDLELAEPTIAVYEGSSIGSLSSLASAHHGCAGGRVNTFLGGVEVEAGHTYWIQISVASWSEILGAPLTWDFNTSVPANDDFADAHEIPATLPQTIAADNGLASDEADEPYLQDWGPRHGLWFKWTAPAEEQISIDTCSTEISGDGDPPDSVIDVFSAGDPVETATLDHKTRDDDGCQEPGTLLSHAYLYAQAGTTYFIRVSNYSAEFGSPFVLKLRTVGAPELPRLPVISPDRGAHGVGELLSATHDPWVGDPWVDPITYQWQRCDASGASCAEIDGATGYEYTTEPEDAGHTLRVVVSGANSDSTTSNTTLPSSLVQDRPDNDDFANAQLLDPDNPSVDGDNWFATIEDGEDVLGEASSSVWYRWTAPTTKNFRVSTCTTEFSWLPIQLAIYRADGDGFENLTETASDFGGCGDYSGRSRLNFTADGGTEYFIRVAGDDSEGDFPLSISATPTPRFTTDPTLSGTAIEGGTLTLDEGEWSSEIPGSASRAWEICDGAGENCEPDSTVDDEFDLTQAVVGSRIRAVVTVTNDNGSTVKSVLSDVIAADRDGDGVADGSDTCPDEAGDKPNGCLASAVVPVSPPVVTGTPQVGKPLTTTNGSWDTLHDPLPLTFEYVWQRCSDAAATDCSPISGGAAASYTLVEADRGAYIRSVVTAGNDDDDASQPADPVGPVESAPNSGGGGDMNPPPATDPVASITLAKSLGKLKLKKGRVTIAALGKVRCGTAAIGSCPGSLTIATKKSGKTRAQTQTFKFKVAPGGALPTTYKISSKFAAALKKAKSLKAALTVKFGAPGWPAKSAKSSATLTG